MESVNPSYIFFKLNSTAWIEYKRKYTSTEVRNLINVNIIAKSNLYLYSFVFPIV